ncbi:flagellar assembly peptidoglycan hydrolase FlgJ [Luteimonas viscosa]|uniref:Peptidoglycan hydrolase FlgJ n=1 Tax=Luteimonas viscosa TaxID=1132694 RepID=A0A5D4XNY6_9GAMM|nr:flagellar assembly peptidoglycan hydrolase FlgJ [Luteimonas viscosa]TYT26299.1 flagellar assembly peptidoglycan hydrolase FlgJ [Luteimonas viscosa]
MRLPAATAIELSPSQATPRAGIEKAARELETQFAQMLIKTMRSASPDGGLGGDTRYRDMYDQQLARELSKGRGLGLAPMIMRQLERSAGGTEPAPAAPAAMPLRIHGQPPGMLPLSGASGMLPLAPTRSGVSMPGLDVQAYAPPRPAQPDPAFDLSSAAAVADAPLDASSPEAFVQSIWPQAQKAAAELGVPARALVAQAALETGWGRRFAGRENTSSLNLFGIKATGGWQGERMSARTHEFVGGKRVDERADFRAYGSVAESFADYTRLIGRDRYAAARGTGDDVHRFASALQKAGYATDPSYAAKITAIANGATLNRALAAMPARQPSPVQYASAAPAPAADRSDAVTTTASAAAAGTRG